MTYILSALLGIGAGCVYAGVSIGLVLTYRGTGLVNFAQVGFAIWGIYVFALLRNSGNLVLPIGHIQLFNGPAPVVLSAVLSMAVVGVLAGISYVFVFRPLWTAPLLSRVVASVALSVVLTVLIPLRFGTEPQFVVPFLPQTGIQIHGVTVPEDRFILLGIVALMTIGFTLLSARTRFGLVSRAGAESDRLTTLLGYSQQFIAAVNWIVAALAATLIAILAVSITGLDTSSYEEFLVPALAALLVARLSSIWLASLSALLIGMVQSMVLQANGYSWMPDILRNGDSAAVPFVILVGVLLLRGQKLPSRDELVTGRLPVSPAAKHPQIGAIIGMLLGVAGVLSLTGTYRLALIISLVTAIVLMSLTVLTGFMGQISLAQGALCGVGAFALARLGSILHLPFPVVPLLAILIGTLIGAAIAAPALRLRGLELALVSVAGAVVIVELGFNNPVLVGSLNGGQAPSLTIAGKNLSIVAGTYPNVSFGIIVVIITVAVGWGVARLRTSRLGWSMLAVRANERAAAGAGLNVTRIKFSAILVSSFVASIGGVFLAYTYVDISSASFSLDFSLFLLVSAILGGVGVVTGSVVAGLSAAGGLFAILLDQWFGFGQYVAVIGGLGALFVLVTNPDGLVPANVRMFRLCRSWLARRLQRSSADASESVGPARVGEHELASPLSSITVVDASAAASRLELSQRLVGEPLLEVRGLSVRFGSTVANDSIDLAVYTGEIVGLIGPNGSGKTTLIDAITGYIPSSGSVKFISHDISGIGVDRISRMGIRRSFQSLELFNDLTVLENILISSPRGTTVDDAMSVLRAVHLDQHVDRLPSSLSYAESKLLAIGRTLCGTPRLFAFDEPAAGLDLTERRQLTPLLRQLVARNGDDDSDSVGVLLVDHDMTVVFNTCDYVYVLRNGSILAQGPPSDVRNNPAVVEAYLGAEEEDGEPSADEGAISAPSRLRMGSPEKAVSDGG